MCLSFEDVFLEKMLDAVFLVSNEGLIANANEAACGMLGYRKEKLLKLEFKEICSSPSLESLASSIPLKEQELSLISGLGGKINVSANITSGFSREDEVLITARDNGLLKGILERFPLYKNICNKEELPVSRGEVVCGSAEGKADFVGRIAAGIAHEVKNPLGNVQLAVESLRKSAEEGSVPRRHFDLILRNTEKINHLIIGLLDCARPVKPDVKPCDIHQIIEDVIYTERERARKKKIKTRTKFCRGPSVLSVDGKQLERVFTNLVLNAFDAVEEGGRVTVETLRENGYFRIKFKDNGCGIEKSGIDKLFDPFYSSKPGGIGLGLSLCCGVISNHRGDLIAESEPGKGAVFTVSLPAGREGEEGSP